MRAISADNSLHRAIRNLVAFMFVLGLVAACASGGARRDLAQPGPGIGPDGQALPGGTPPARPAVKVALLLPLGAPGSTAGVARALKQAGELALFDFDNPNVTLMAKDTRGTPDGAKAAALAAVSSGAELIIGPLFSKSVAAAAPIARQANIPMIAFSSDRKVAGNGVYLLSFLAGSDVPRIVGYAISRGKRRFAGLIPKGAYGDIVEQTFRSAIARGGGQLVALERIPLDANGMLEPTKRIAALAKTDEDTQVPPQVDAIFMPVGPDSLPTVAALVPYYEIDTAQVQLLGTGLWDYPNVGKEKPLVGGWYPAPDPKGWRAFTQRYVKTYEKTPPRLASLAYDAVSLAVSLSNNPRGQRYTPQQLTRGSGFAGVDGLFRLLSDGTSERGLAVLQVQRLDSRVVDPAPSVFRTAQF
jgi:ABC-type branched-subunit amino acid transport system substrate-binding protein